MPYTDDEEKQYKELLGRAGGGGGGGGGAPASDAPETGGGQFRQGAAQGLLNIVEGPAQWAEQGIRHLPGLSEFKMPLHDWAANYRREAESSPAGLAGELAGTAAPFFLPLGALAEGIRGPALASDLARITAAASRLPGAARAAGLASRVAASPASGEMLAAWRNLGAGERAFAKGAAGSTIFAPKSSEHFGREAMEDALVGGVLGKAGQIGERLFKGGPAIEDLYKEGKIPWIFRREAQEQWRAPKTRPPEKGRTEDIYDPRGDPREASRLKGAINAARRAQEDIRNPSPRRATIHRNFEEEGRLRDEMLGRSAAREWEQQQEAYRRARGLGDAAGHMGWHLPFMIGPGMGIPMAGRYFLGSILSRLARQWGRHAARQASRAHRESLYRRLRGQMDRASPFALGAVGGTAYQQTPTVDLMNDYVPFTNIERESNYG